MTKPSSKGSTAILTTAGSSMISIAAGILLLPLIISTVGSGEYGVWLILSAVAMYLQLSDFGVGAAVIHFNSRNRGGKSSHGLSELLGAATAWNVAAALAVLPAFGFGAYAYLSSTGSRDLLTAAERDGLLALSLVAVSVIALRPFDAALVSQGWLPRERAHFSAGLVLRIVGTVAVCLTAPSVLWVACVEVAGILLPSVLSCVYAIRSGVRVRWNRETFGVLRFVMRFSSRAFGAGAIGLLILQGGTVLSGVIVSPQDATYFNAAFRVYQGVRNLASWTTQPFRSAQSKLFATDRERAKQLLLTVSLSSVLTAVIVSTGIALSAPFLVSVWLGSDVPTETVSTTLIIMLMGVMLNSIHGPLVNAGDAAGHPGVFIPIQLLWLALFAALAFILGPVWGTAGIAAALSLPLVLIEVVYLVVGGRLLGFSLRQWTLEVLWPVGAIALVPALMACMVWVVWRPAQDSALSLLPSLIFAIGAAAALWLRMKRDQSVQRVGRLLHVEL